MITITNAHNVARGEYEGFCTRLLLGEKNTGSREISIQVTDVEPGAMQTLHEHPQDQCYYIIEGKGRVIIDEEQADVKRGDAIFIPGSSLHGIKNTGKNILKYLTANRAFGKKREKEIWCTDDSAHKPERESNPARK